jgi:type IV pilus assembly protein PilB
MGIEPFLFSSTISGIIAQRLVRKVCPSCGEEHVSDEREMKFLQISEPVKLKKGKGCSLCNNSGYKGRVGIYEIMEISPEVKKLIDDGATESDISKTAEAQGMTILRQSCIKKVLSGVTTVEEMLRVTYGY